MPPLRIRLSRAIARACLLACEIDPGVEPEPTPVAGANQVIDAACPSQSGDLVALFQELRGTKRQFDRDELERLMFAYRFLLSEGTGDDADPFEQLDLADLLHEACRSALRVANSDPRVLPYLRPYYDAVFATRLKHQPVGSKELIDLAWEATTGELTPPAHPGEPVLAMFYSGGCCHLLLDVPGGTSGRFRVDEEEVGSPEAFRLAEAGEWGRRSCPDAVRRSLRGIELDEGQRLWVLFRDPVLEIAGPNEEFEISRGPLIEGVEPAVEGVRFPFDVLSALAKPGYLLGELRPAEEGREPSLRIPPTGEP